MNIWKGKLKKEDYQGNKKICCLCLSLSDLFLLYFIFIFILLIYNGTFAKILGDIWLGW